MMVSKEKLEKIREQVGKGKANTRFVCNMCYTRQFMGIEKTECNSYSCHNLQTLCYLAKEGYDCDVYTVSESGALVAVLVMPADNKWGYSVVYHNANQIIIADETWESYDQYGADAETMPISNFCEKIGF